MMNADHLDTYQLEAVLEFYLASGVDAVLETTPQDRFAESAARAAAPRPAREPVFQRDNTPAPSPEFSDRTTTETTVGPARRLGAKPSARTSATAAVPPSAPLPDKDVIMAAREQAGNAATLEELHGTLVRFEGCNLKRTAKNLCFADGNPAGRVMLIGEAPGREEDIQGKPFVGRSGQLLDRMLSAIGLDREQVYVANVVPWRPPGNRTPSPQETEICKPFIERQIELADPDFLVFLGGASAKQLIGVREGILRLRGKWKTYDAGPKKIPCIATLHPAYLLRQPQQKKLAWRDLLALKAALLKPEHG